MAVYGVSQDLGAIDAEGIGPVLERGRIVIWDTKAEHRHTTEITAYYTGRGRFLGPETAATLLNASATTESWVRLTRASSLSRTTPSRRAAPKLPGVDQRARVSFPPGTLRRWDRHVNEQPAREEESNRVTFVGAGRPATREEILAFVADNNARHAREHQSK